MTVCNALHAFWPERRVLVTGHTGFKGSWLSLWLTRLGARVSGFALPPPTNPSLFELARVGDGMRSILADLRDASAVREALRETHPEIIFHLAAQPLVRQSYADPAETYATNVMGLIHLLEAARQSNDARAIIVVTSDKCYENREWLWGYREDDPLGGYDPYSSSKACAEIIAASWRRSFFRAAPALATARAGNVIGGGDWAEDRLLPDLLDAFSSGRPATLRNPNAERPWQHVLEPLRGYLLLAERLFREGAPFAEAWNFGPAEEDARPTRQLAEALAQYWPDSPNPAWIQDPATHPHEARALKLDASKSRARLGWKPRWNLAAALMKTAEWHKAYLAGEDMRVVTLGQISAFEQKADTP